MPLSSKQLQQKIAELHNLSFDALMKELDPKYDGLRWLNDREYAKEIAEKVWFTIQPKFDLPPNLTLLPENCAASTFVMYQKRANLSMLINTTYLEIFALREKADAALWSFNNSIRHGCVTETQTDLRLLIPINFIEIRDAHLLDQSDSCRADIYREFGIIYLLAGEQKIALEQFQEAEKIFDREKTLPVCALPIKNYIVLCEFLLGQNAMRAVQKFATVNMLYKKLNNFEDQVSNPDYCCLDYGLHLMHYASALIINKEFERAIPLLKEAVKLHERLQGEQKIRVAEIYELQAQAYAGLTQNSAKYLEMAKTIYETLPQPNQEKVTEITVQLEHLNSDTRSPASLLLSKYGLYAITATASVAAAIAMRAWKNSPGN